MESVSERQSDFYLASAPVRSLILRFSIPCILSMLVSALYNIVDQVFVGMKLGASGIFATSIVYPFTVIALAFALLIGDGCAALFSISLGAKDEKTAKKCAGNAVAAMIAAGIALSLVGFAFGKHILSLCGATTEAMGITGEYYYIILIGIPFYVITSAMSGIIRADGSPQFAMMATVLGAVINLILDPVMIFGLNWGMRGAAFATIIGQIASALVSLSYIKKPKLMTFGKGSVRLSASMTAKMCRLGISSFITQFAIVLISVVVNNVVRAINDPVLGVAGPGGTIGVVFKVFAVVIAFSVGFAVGGQPVIGYNYGAKNYKRVFQAYRYVILFNAVTGIVATALFWLCPSIFARLFSIEELYLDFACSCFRIFLGGILLCCLQKASCIFLQAINRPYKAMALSLSRDVVFLMPLVCIFGFQGGLHRMLYAGLLSDVLSFICTALIIAHEYRSLMKSLAQQNGQDAERPQETAAGSYAVTIGREFGCGGKRIAQELAKRLGAQCFDSEILTRLAEDTKISLATLQAVDEREKDSFWYNAARNALFSEDGASVASPEDALFLAKSKIVEQLYREGPCVIVGRCSNEVLRNKERTVHIFVYSSDMEARIASVMKDECIERGEAEKRIADTDKMRANYYRRYTGETWGDRRNYNICIDTATLGIERSIDVLEQFARAKLGI